MNHINSNNSYWLFIAASNEPRHLYDLIYGFNTLIKIGIAKDKIFVFSDYFYNSAQHFSEIYAHRILNLNDFEYICSSLKLNYENNLFVATSGHGNEHGFLIESSQIQIKSQQFINALKLTQARYCCCIFSQCYSGIFNYIDTQRNKNENNSTEFVVLGSTNLNKSLSIPSEKMGIFLPNSSYNEHYSWPANIFFIYIFQWLELTKNKFNFADIDGDHFASLLDCYRFAGSSSNMMFERTKSGIILDLLSHYHEIQAKILAIQALQISQEEKDYHASMLHSQLNNMTDTISLHQEPWLLNANLARKFIFSFVD